MTFARREIALVLALSTLAFVLNMHYRGLVIRNQALYPDDGHFTTVGWLMATHEYVPYRDIFDHKPPLTYFMLALSNSFGDSVESTRWPIALVTIASGFSLTLLGWRWFANWVVGGVATLLYLFDFAIITWGSIPRTEALAASMGILGIACCALLPKSEKWRPVLFLIGGVLLGLSFLSKQNAVFYLIVALPSVLTISVVRKRTMASLVYPGVLFVGFLLPLLLTWYYLRDRGALIDAFDQIFRFNTAIAAPQIHKRAVALMFLLLFVGNPLIWTSALASIMPARIVRRFWAPIVLVISLGVLSLAAMIVAAPTNSGLNDYSQIFVASSRRQLGVGLLACGLLLGGWVYARRAPMPRLEGILQSDWFLLLAAGAVIVPNNALYGDSYVPNYDTSFLLIAPASLLAASFLSLYLPKSVNWRRMELLAAAMFVMLLPMGGKLWHGSLAHQLENAATIERFVPHDQQVYMFPINSGYYFLTHRRPGSRYAYISHLFAEKLVNDDVLRSNLTADLKRVPRIVVWSDNAARFGADISEILEKAIEHRAVLYTTDEYTIYGNVD